MRRREFITLLGGAAAWPLAVRAQQRERMRRVVVLMAFTSDDPEGQARVLAFAQALQQLGWMIGQNLRIDTRWGAGDPDRDHHDDEHREQPTSAHDERHEPGAVGLSHYFKHDDQRTTYDHRRPHSGLWSG